MEKEKLFIRAVLEQRGIKPGELAKRLDVTRLTLYRWIAGERKWPFDKAMLAAKILGVTAETLEYVRQKQKPDSSDDSASA